MYKIEYEYSGEVQPVKETLTFEDAISFLQEEVRFAVDKSENGVNYTIDGLDEVIEQQGDFVKIEYEDNEGSLHRNTYLVTEI